MHKHVVQAVDSRMSSSSSSNRGAACHPVHRARTTRFHSVCKPTCRGRVVVAAGEADGVSPAIAADAGGRSLTQMIADVMNEEQQSRRSTEPSGVSGALTLTWVYTGSWGGTAMLVFRKHTAMQSCVLHPPAPNHEATAHHRSNRPSLSTKDISAECARHMTAPHDSRPTPTCRWAASLQP